MKATLGCLAVLSGAMLIGGCDKSSSTPSAPAPSGPAPSGPAPSGPGAPGTVMTQTFPSALSAVTANPSATAVTADALPGPPRVVTDTIKTNAGDVKITPVKHATTLLQFDGKNIYVDPWKDANYTGLPTADYIFITDVHPDHMDQAAIDRIKTPTTILVGPAAVNETIKLDIVIANGETKTVGPIKVGAIAMYNVPRGPAPTKKFHEKGRGNGYVLTFGDKRIYFSGDTECTPEMKALQNIDVAFVCMNLPYTMPPNEAAECIKAFKPKILIPYHYRETNLDDLDAAMKGEKSVEIRRRAFY